MGIEKYQIYIIVDNCRIFNYIIIFFGIIIKYIYLFQNLKIK